MSARYDELKGLKNLGQKYAYTDREVMLYAYGIGLGADPMDENELPFVNEGGLALRPRRRRLWRAEPDPAGSSQDPGGRPRPDHRHRHASRPGAGLSCLRRPQPAALRP